VSAEARAPALVVLAAGAAERLGAVKALVRLREGEPGTPLALLLAAGAAFDGAPALVIAGRAASAIARALPAGAECLANPRWSAGRTGGVQLACARRPGQDLCLAPVDVPLVPRAVFAALHAEWQRLGRPARGWLAPCVERAGERRHGHPVVVGRELLLELKDFPPDRPLRELRGRAAPCAELLVDSESVLDDLDSPADLVRLRARLGGEGVS